MDNFWINSEYLEFCRQVIFMGIYLQTEIKHGVSKHELVNC